MDYVKLGERLKEARKACRMSQQELAFEIDFSVPHISHVEQGGTKASMEFVVKASNALKTTPDHLLCDSLEEAEQIYQQEIMEHLRDCSGAELRIISRMIKDMKVNLKENL